MGHLSYAFSVHHFISSVGADAGFASIIGLAILVLLYFAHARETAALRHQAEEASARVAELERRLGQAARQAPSVVPPAVTPAAARVGSPLSVSGAPGTASGGGTPSAAPVSAAGLAGAYPGAPAGVGAPPLSAATRLIPGVAAAAAPVDSATAAGEQGPGGSSEAQVAAVPGPGGQRVGARTTASNGNGEQLAPAPAPAPRPPVQVRSGGAGRVSRAGAPVQPVRARARGGPRRGPRGLLALLIALGLAAVVAALLLITSAGGGKRVAPGAPAPVSNAPVVHHRPRSAPFRNSSVIVSVLNGTPTFGLARRISTRLGAAGFRQGTITSASDQTRTATVVGYLSGHRSGALAVAKALKLGSGSVHPIDPGAQTLACPPSSACTTGVVVTVGADLSTQ